MEHQSAQSLQDLLADLDHIGEAWLHADEQAAWFSAADEFGDVEPYRLERDGTLTSWSVNDFGSPNFPTCSAMATTFWPSVFVAG